MIRTTESNPGIEAAAKYFAEALLPKSPLERGLELSVFALPVAPLLLFRLLRPNRLFLVPTAAASFWIWRQLNWQVKLQPGAKFIISEDQTEVRGQVKLLDLAAHWLGGLAAFVLFIRALIRPRRSRPRRGQNFLSQKLLLC